METLAPVPAHLVPTIKVRVTRHSLVRRDIDTMRQRKPVVAFIIAILALLNFVPALGEVLHDVENDVAREGHVHIVPRHTRRGSDVDSVGHEVLYILEVDNASVVVVLAWEERAAEVSRVHVRQRVRVGVPATETDVQTTNARAMVVYDYNLLMVRPKLDVI